MRDRILSIIPINDLNFFMLEQIAKTLHSVFSLPVEIKPEFKIPAALPGMLHDNRYNSTMLLQYISENILIHERAAKILAITELDLYSPIFAKIYGEAQLGGKYAVMSTYRLRLPLNGSSNDGLLVISRCQKEAVHEIGHTFGLIHCRDCNCIMYPSSALDDTDSKSDSLCPVCNELLQPAIKKMC